MRMIVAHANNRAIGKGNDLPWRLPEDMRFFKETTLLYKNLLVGKNTLLSLPNQNLPKRNLFVLSTSQDIRSNITVLRSKEEALEANKTTPLMVIGGQKIYETFLPYTTSIFVTRIATDIDGADTHFPVYENDFRHAHTLKNGISNELAFSIEIWERK